MTTRADIRASLRLRLEDIETAPLWDDPVLNDAIATAIGMYGGAFPRQATTGLTVTAGTTRVESPVPIDGRRIARVIDALGILVSPWPLDLERGLPPVLGRGQAWRWWGDALVLAEPVATSAAGIWTVEHLAGRELPTSDDDELDILPGDEPIVLARTLVWMNRLAVAACVALICTASWLGLRRSVTQPPVASAFPITQSPPVSIRATGKPTSASSGTSLNPGSAK